MKVQIVVTHQGKSFQGEFELSAAPAKKTAKVKEPSSVEALPTRPGEAIEQLYERSFFKVARTLADTMGELEKKEYNFNRPSVLMALQRAQFIQRRGRKGSYKFIQKYPAAARR